MILFFSRLYTDNTEAAESRAAFIWFLLKSNFELCVKLERFELFCIWFSYRVQIVPNLNMFQLCGRQLIGDQGLELQPNPAHQPVACLTPKETKWSK